MTNEQKAELDKALWDIANQLRGKIQADDFRDYILGFIFYKYLSDKITIAMNKALESEEKDFITLDENNPDDKDYLDGLKEEAINTLGYFLKPTQLFSHVAQHSLSNEDDDEFILTVLPKIFDEIEKSTQGEASADDFVHLFEDIDLASTKLGRETSERATLIANIMNRLGEIEFDIENNERDVLGDAYEYLIGKFASNAGKTAGEFYTPAQVSKIIADIVTTRQQNIKTVYDPACGSGSLLLAVNRKTKDKLKIYGQELTRTTHNLARMNMIMHNVHYRDFDIKRGDSLEDPRHIDIKFDAVIANPPFSAQWSANPIHENDDRFAQYGRLAPQSKADYAFITHMLYHLDDSGTMAVIVPHGVLFRGAAEGAIRRFLIEERNYLDAVIGLPSNIFYGTSIPACILVLKKCREQDADILFIDASQDFLKVKNKNELRDEDVNKIVQCYQNRNVIDKYSACIALSKIAENDYNLNIPRYVDRFEAEAVIDLEVIVQELRAIDADMGAVDAKIAGYCKELNIESPF
ncbi:MAG: type I restriction-modification system subunit M [Alphaproteobacteria bacterium]|nr:type I restriction-modification system subunit M [Alphaproteobacteria bacterium]